MEREILFRGKLKKNGAWIYGVPTYDFKYIFNSVQADSCDNYEVTPETIGQYTGLTDKNGTKIFEGDIIGIYTSSGDKICRTGYVIFNKGKYVNKYNNAKYLDELGIYGRDQQIEILGNIIDTPELLNK